MRDSRPMRKAVISPGLRSISSTASAGTSSDGAVGYDDVFPDPIAELIGHLGADHRLEDPVERLPLAQIQAPVPGVAIVLEIVGAGPHDPETLVRIPEGDRHSPLHNRVGRDVLKALPGNVVSGVADVEH